MINPDGHSIDGAADASTPSRQLSKEIQLLREEIDMLHQENSLLRDEVTRLRLYNQVEAASANQTAQVRIPETIPETLRTFFYVLPTTFNRAEYFSLAEGLGYHIELARHILLLFTKEHLLINPGPDLFSKADLNQFELPLP